MNTPASVVALAALLGLVLGSFLNVCIVRWPALQSVVRPRSRCPQCGSHIAWYDNVPVVSWVLLRARCRHCQLPIPWRYPLIELVIAAIWGVSVWHYGPEAEALRAAVFGTLLLGIAVTDAREYIIPDEFSLGGAVVGLAFAALASWRGGADPHAVSWGQSLIGAATGLGLLWLIAFAGAKALRQDAMGGGDVKMMAMIGAFLGWQGVLLTLFIGALLGTLVFLPLRIAGRDRPVPFGIFLALAAAVCWICQPSILSWYAGFMR